MLFSLFSAKVGVAAPVLSVGAGATYFLSTGRPTRAAPFQGLESGVFYGVAPEYAWTPDCARLLDRHVTSLRLLDLKIHVRNLLPLFIALPKMECTASAVEATDYLDM
jgi:hypothetical protein